LIRPPLLQSERLAMSGDELVVSAIAVGAAAIAWLRWYRLLFSVPRLGPSRRGRAWLGVSPLLSALILVAVLTTIAAHDVVDDLRYILMYLALGAAWVGLTVWSLPFAGMSPRDDVVERGNAAAAPPCAAAVIALTLCFAGGNVGDGPGWWVVVFAAAIATLGLFAVWLVLDVLAALSDAVTIERDAAAGLRLAGFLVACGLVLGRGVAGDWVSVGATIRDVLRSAAPLTGLIPVAAVLERAARPTPERPEPPVGTLGVVPALAYVAGAAAYVVWLGFPP
jgi:hypothetical protein